MIKNKKVELFFVSALLLNLLPFSVTIHLLCSFMVALLFLRGRIKIIVLILVIIFGLAGKYSFIVTEHMFDTKGSYVYKTTSGTYFSEVELEPGDMLAGKFIRKMTKYGVNIYSNGRNYRFRLPVVSYLLYSRKNLSEKLYYSSGRKAGLTNALVMGDKNFLPDTLVDKFTVTGLNHLLAISGLHVGIILGGVLWLLSFLHMKLRFLISLPFLILLMPFTGFKITVIRAVLFALIVMSAYFFDVKTDLKKMILFAAGVFMLIDPEITGDISFLLSFSAVFGIVYFIHNNRNYENRDKYPWLIEPVKVGIAATIFTSPFILYYFGNFNYMGVLNTVLMLPFISVLIILGFSYLISPAFLLKPLVVFENFTLEFLELLYKWTYPFFVLNKIDYKIFIAVISLMLLIVLLKRRILLLFVLLIPLIPQDNSDGIYIPKMVRSKGFINIAGNKKEIFYKGWYSDFKYSFLPLAAELSMENFESGDINIYDGENMYINIHNKTRNFSNICINKISPGCRYIFKTRSNTVDKKDYSKNYTYLIYKNKLKKDNIIQLSRYKSAVKIFKGDVVNID
ncbi:MAG: ComEC/Rec2 family competence protein [Flexistipes sinusarabici]|uniref:ComEC/Rec2 family competence protein n=1 Tax=Flexistipes sinusarabici TaxID=2352 RepID=A0A5D0MQQ3_FLESI|nr:ComEC/Rec2 family competence protein [Flexistipes sinusarabici]TYB33758.1 MAG: ComEC/Rec2 family competence protein [Flexistipes sinusarabici]